MSLKFQHSEAVMTEHQQHEQAIDGVKNALLLWLAVLMLVMTSVVVVLQLGNTEHAEPAPVEVVATDDG